MLLGRKKMGKKCKDGDYVKKQNTFAEENNQFKYFLSTQMHGILKTDMSFRYQVALFLHFTMRKLLRLIR